MRDIFTKLILLILLQGTAFHSLGLGDDRSQKIDFEGSVVEGMNKKPLDSLSYLSDQDRRKKSTLYTVRTEYTEENKLLLKELGFSQ